MSESESEDRSAGCRKQQRSLPSHCHLLLGRRQDFKSLPLQVLNHSSYSLAQLSQQSPDADAAGGSAPAFTNPRNESDPKAKAQEENRESKEGYGANVNNGSQQPTAKLRDSTLRQQPHSVCGNIAIPGTPKPGLLCHNLKHRTAFPVSSSSW